MVPVIGSGKFIMTPIILDDGQPVVDTSVNNDQGGRVNRSPQDKKVVNWMLTLHQIGTCILLHSLPRSFPFLSGF